VIASKGGGGVDLASKGHRRKEVVLKLKGVVVTITRKSPIAKSLQINKKGHYYII